LKLTKDENLNQKIHQSQVYWPFFFDIHYQSYVLNAFIPRKYCKILKEVKIESGIISMMHSKTQVIPLLDSIQRYFSVIEGPLMDKIDKYLEKER